MELYDIRDGREWGLGVWMRAGAGVDGLLLLRCLASRGSSGRERDGCGVTRGMGDVGGLIR
jgi:hypothetical protein